MNTLFTLLFSTMLLVTAPAKDTVSPQLTIRLSGREYQFKSHLVTRQLTAQHAINPNATLGFFTDRNDIFPFYFSCVLADLKGDAVLPGQYPALPMKDDLPAVSQTITRGGFIAMKMNSPNVANPEEYTAMPGPESFIIIEENNDHLAKGSFNARMYCVTDSTRQITISGTFVLSK
ncbi:hypothetical protein CLV59_10165 [Chitinophaga dinghuensis]|uniref:Uncharacterized protein n=1 Tax=Chitinophaga dinghuensis TaxID=1539050 RepID=A0A327WCV5_9BACT|nr:hypothetical protein [Chitinophaga dinghuensis]RAJ87316.1 hypothetical protein CLV59_10165 [Chitinophaga dinghuensis]